MLSAAERMRYERDGCLFPLSALTPAETERFRAEYEHLEPLLTGPARGQCHLHFRWARELATHPAILDLAECLIGPDILVHSTTLFCKRPGDRTFVSWHQDGYTWGLSEPLLVTAWLALSDSTVENGCMRAIPGSHARRLSHAERPQRYNLLRRTGLEILDEIDEEAAVAVELRAGELSVHHPDLVHGSSPNVCGHSRLGFVARYVSPAVRQESNHHPVVLARGSDAHGHYARMDEPPPPDFDAGMEAHTAFWQQVAPRAACAS
jgi:non-haem Fe2+, alpha-ketoglutarate-dependent halogenase